MNYMKLSQMNYTKSSVTHRRGGEIVGKIDTKIRHMILNDEQDDVYTGYEKLSSYFNLIKEK